MSLTLPLQNFLIIGINDAIRKGFIDLRGAKYDNWANSINPRINTEDDAIHGGGRWEVNFNHLHILYEASEVGHEELSIKFIVNPTGKIDFVCSDYDRRYGDAAGNGWLERLTGKWIQDMGKYGGKREITEYIKSIIIPDEDLLGYKRIGKSFT